MRRLAWPLRWWSDAQAYGRRRGEEPQPEDQAQRAKAGTTIGLLPKSKVLKDFGRIVRGKKR